MSMTLSQIPAPGSFHIHRCGDVFEIKLKVKEDGLIPYLRTSLGGAKKQREALIKKTEDDQITSHNNWVDLNFEQTNNKEYRIALPLYEVGYFEAKVWFNKEGSNELIWAPGDNVIVKVEPASTIANNSIYGVFTRQFGPNKEKAFALDQEASTIKQLDKKGYHVIPPSGTFRDVIKELDHIMDDMGFRILQLLPIHPTPTTFARMGRFGSPYAALDFFSVDAALAEFDKKATPLDQFIELVDEVHRRDGEIFLDIPVDHTGWASTLQKDHPEFFVKDNEGDFVSPGAWGTTWEDLVKLDFNNLEVHKLMADVFLFWCKQGVDGFRCDAGYMVPFDAWEYIIAKVRAQFPDTIFLLEGLGGPPEVTEDLLARATFTWAYSELFQNYSKDEVTHYTNNMLRISYNKGGLVNFSETHDNSRLASESHTWSRMRNLLCALTAPAGGFGISNGVEFYAEEKISVHHASGLNWGNEANQIDLIKRLTTIFKVHPAFKSNAIISPVYQGNPDLFMCHRTAKNGDKLLVIVNLNCEHKQEIDWHSAIEPNDNPTDLISGKAISRHTNIKPGAALLLDDTDIYNERIERFVNEKVDNTLQLQRTKETLLRINAHFNGFANIESNYISKNIEKLLKDPLQYCISCGASLGQVVHWDCKTDAHRHVMASNRSILLIQGEAPFSYSLACGKLNLRSGKSIQKSDGSYFVLVPLGKNKEKEIEYLDITVKIGTDKKEGEIALLPKGKVKTFRQSFTTKEVKARGLYGLCTNKAGSMSQVSGIWGEYNSKYDSFFAPNLDSKVPVDRTAMISRWRCWVVFNNFSHEIREKSQIRFSADGSTNISWDFKAPTGQGEYVLLHIHLNWDEDKDQASLRFIRQGDEEQLDLLNSETPVSVIIRPDLEYRTNHEVTKAFMGADTLFPSSTHPSRHGFIFNPYHINALCVEASGAKFYKEPEWSFMHHLSVEADRGLEATTDLYSPGYFKVDLKEGEKTILNASIDTPVYITNDITPIPETEKRDIVLKRSMSKYIVRRDAAQTVIAGYPWFLDWGRDTLICLRGIIAADMKQESKDIIRTFAQYEENGTLPNMIRGNNASNRDTTDAPLWFVVAIKDYIEHFNEATILNMECGGRTVRAVIKSIVNNYSKGTPNGIQMDKESGLIYSPSHYTWMDTNYPAGTPRVGYPIEIQSFWQAAVSFLSTIDKDAKWIELAAKIKHSIIKHYPLDYGKGLADCLHTDGFQPAKDAIKDNACRCNQLFAVNLQVLTDSVHINSVLIATQSLIFPGSIRSLKDAPVSPPLAVYRDGHLLNDPDNPYWGHYTGDEDTRRKPAYHNGTGWSWPFFSYCEALFNHTKDRSCSLAILMSAKQELEKGIVNHMPEVSDGNTPHQQRGCLAQAWSVTEFYRVLNIISKH